ncbi:Hypothetical predicted protein, partial [Paramuricea clavata]
MSSKIDGLSEIFNNLCQLNTKFVNHKSSRNGDKRSTCELGTQTDLYSEQSVAQDPPVAQTADINLSTEIEDLKNRSCVTQLLSVFHAIGKSLDKNIETNILYLDFAKAFDSVDHDILLAKLKSYGVSGNLLNWFTDYLHGRVERVAVDGVTSDWATVTSGVPQGSLLDPLLFVIFINDFPYVVSDASQTALYAGDSKLYKSISCLGSCESLQQSLNHLSIWSHNNNISFNASKCK